MESLKAPFSYDESLTFEFIHDPNATAVAESTHLIFPAAYHSRQGGYQESPRRHSCVEAIPSA